MEFSASLSPCHFFCAVVLPAGMPFDPCFTQGNCPDSVLTQIHDAWMPIKIVYLAVDFPDGAYSHVPLRMADTQWTPGMATAAAASASSAEQAPALGRRVYLPRIQRTREPSGCPCGAFEPGGRMVHYIE